MPLGDCITGKKKSLEDQIEKKYNGFVRINDRKIMEYCMSRRKIMISRESVQEFIEIYEKNEKALNEWNERL